LIAALVINSTYLNEFGGAANEGIKLDSRNLLRPEETIVATTRCAMPNGHAQLRQLKKSKIIPLQDRALVSELSTHGPQHRFRCNWNYSAVALTRFIEIL